MRNENNNELLEFNIEGTTILLKSQLDMMLDSKVTLKDNDWQKLKDLILELRSYYKELDNE